MSKYDDYHAAHDARAERAGKLTDLLALALCEYGAGAWAVRHHGASAELVCERDGMQLHAVLTDDRPERLRVQAIGPRIENDPFGHQSGPVATVDPDRPMDRIVAEVRRKVIDPFAPVLEEIRARQRTVLEHRERAVADFRRLCAFLGTLPGGEAEAELRRGGDVALHVNGEQDGFPGLPSNRLRVSAYWGEASVSFDLRGPVTVDVLIRMLASLRPPTADGVLHLCAHCDRFVDLNPSYEKAGDPVAPWLHLEDGETEVGHEAIPDPCTPAHPLAEWQRLRPDLFAAHPDGRIGPNSRHHRLAVRLDRDAPVTATAAVAV